MTQALRGITWHPCHGLTSRSSFELALTPCQQTRGFRVNWPCHRALPIVWHIVFVDMQGYMGSSNISPRVHLHSSYVIICSCWTWHGADVKYIGFCHVAMCIVNDYYVTIEQLHASDMCTCLCHLWAHWASIYSFISGKFHCVCWGVRGTCVICDDSVLHVDA